MTISLEEYIQNKVYCILASGFSNVQLNMPEQAFSVKNLPAIVVEEGEVLNEERYSYALVRTEVELPVTVLVGMNGTHAGETAANKQLSLLCQQIRGRLEATVQMELAFLHVHTFTEYEIKQTNGDFGNHIKSRTIVIRIPVINAVNASYT